MSSNRPRNFRRRAGDDDEDDSTTKANGGGASTPSTIAPTISSRSSTKPSSSAAHNSKVKKPQSSKLLSFHEEEDEGNESPLMRSRQPTSKNSSSRLSKPSSSHKITAAKDRIAQSSSSSSVSTSIPSNVQPQAGTYTKETLLELQKNTRTLASSSRPSADSKPSSEPIIVLKGPLKPVENTVKEASQSDSDDEKSGGREKGSGMFPSVRDDTQSKLASMGIANGKDPSGSLILDQETIKAIKARKERLRQAGAAAPDYISLDSGSNHGAAEGLSDEEPEFRGRIAMFGEKLDGMKKGVFEDVDERAAEIVFRKTIGEEDDEDEEDKKRWEDEQVRKALGKKIDDVAARVGSSDVPIVHVGKQQKFTNRASIAYSAILTQPIVPSIGGTVGGESQGLDGIPISQQAELARKALRDNVTRLKESHNRTVSSLNKTNEDLSASLLNITDLEKSLSAADEKYKFMQQLRNFVANMCDFLQVKSPFIEELEEQMQKLHEDRASAIFERRADDNNDEMVVIEAAVKAAMSVFSKKGNGIESIAAASSAAKAALSAASKQADLPVKLDEYGRDINLQKRVNRKQRADSRQHRRIRSDSKRLSSMEVDNQKIEGESSTDESDTDCQAYQSQRDLVLRTADEIFSDASEEYSKLSLVKQRFEEWRRDYSSSYFDAYMPLSLPIIFAPFVRLELLKWDPLHQGLDFQEMKWYKLLFDYGLSDDGIGNPDADHILVPKLIEEFAVPILQHEITHCWDMLSKQETENAISATKLIVQHITFESEALADLLVAIRKRLDDAVVNLTVPSWSPLILAAVPDSARIAAHRFGVSVRLLRNICLWKDIFALPVLEKIALEGLLYGKVLPHFRSISENIHDAITRTERIIASLSGVWAGSSVIGDQSRKLQPLVEYVMMLLGKILEKRNVPGVTENDINGLARRLKKILVELNEYDKARDVVRVFHLREAL